jgi:hypothetical protein
MKKIFFLLLIFSISISLHAQKRSKGKDKPDISNYDSLAPAPITKKTSKKDDKKGKQVNSNYDSLATAPVSKKNSKKGKAESKQPSVNYTPDVIIPVADTSKKFTGIIKYHITSDDPADIDSVLIVFGENRFRVTMYIPGYREGQIFEKNMIANLNDSTFLELDIKNKTYKTEKLGARNKGTEFSLAPDKKIGKVMSVTCDEYLGEMKTSEGEIFQSACLLSTQHSYISAMDYNFMNIQPLVVGYRVVLGFRTKTPDNENTYILAYKIEPGNTDSYFDLTGYKAL